MISFSNRQILRLSYSAFILTSTYVQTIDRFPKC